jgi:pyridoxal phosphate enzyme (YggS family)
MSITQHLRQVRERIVQACGHAGRGQHDVQLLAVSKTKPLAAIGEAYAVGQRHFGESYAQEAVAKIDSLREQGECGDIVWHFIGPLQSNKTKRIAERFDWVHSVDSEHLIQRLQRQRPAELAPLNICLQLNVSGEASKSGVTELAIIELAAVVAQCDRLVLRGLMAIPEHGCSDEVLAAQMVRMQIVFRTLAHQYPHIDTLSMGMSDDLDLAIAHGSTMVRIGSAIFGARPDRSDPADA